MNLQLIEAREEFKAAGAELKAANDAIQNASNVKDATALQTRFDAAEFAYRKAKSNYDLKRNTLGKANGAGARVTNEPLTYEKGDPTRSIFRDLVTSGRGDFQASKRLDDHKREMRTVLGDAKFDLNSTDATGGHLVAPLYLQDEFISLARAGAPVAATIGPRDLPPNTDTVVIPRMSTGTTVATQANDNAAVSETDASFDNVTAAVLTIAGMQDVSRQVVDRGVPGTDEVIFADLAKAYATLLDAQVITSSTANNLGLLNVTGLNAVTYTAATPTVAGLYPKLADAIQRIHSTVFTPATAIFMHPRRWGWILAALDGQNRPLITPYAPENSAGAQGGVAAEGLVGNLQGIPIYVSANIPTNLGAGTNEDRIIVAATPELFLWTAPGGPFLETFPDVGSGTLTVRFRAHNYWGQCNVRRSAAVSVLAGTGLAAPTF